MTIAESIKELRERVGMSQEQLAEAIGVTQGCVSHWEKGRKVPSAAMIISIADALNVSADDVLGRAASIG